MGGQFALTSPTPNSGWLVPRDLRPWVNLIVVWWCFSRTDRPADRAVFTDGGSRRCGAPVGQVAAQAQPEIACQSPVGACFRYVRVSWRRVGRRERGAWWTPGYVGKCPLSADRRRVRSEPRQTARRRPAKRQQDAVRLHGDRRRRTGSRRGQRSTATWWVGVAFKMIHGKNGGCANFRCLFSVALFTIYL